MISDAQTLLDEAVVGTEPGEYPQTALDDLSAATQAAQAVVEDEEADQGTVDSALSTLALAITAFEASEIE